MKNLQKLGKVLSTKEQKNVNGGKTFCTPCMLSGAGIYYKICGLRIVAC